jgi:hypothetical protein
MFSTERTKMRLMRCLVLAPALFLGGCIQSELFMSPDFGVALRQDLAAQIAEPDARYAGTPAPGADGARAALAQSRYQNNNVIQPTTMTASGYAATGGAGANNAGNAMAPPAPAAGP